MELKTDILPLLHQLMWFKSVCAAVARSFIWPLFDLFPTSPSYRGPLCLHWNGFCSDLQPPRLSPLCFALCPAFGGPITPKLLLEINSEAFCRFWLIDTYVKHVQIRKNTFYPAGDSRWFIVLLNYVAVLCAAFCCICCPFVVFLLSEGTRLWVRKAS